MYNRNSAIPQGLAKIEIIANKNEIDDFLGKGFSYIRIYRELFSQHKITMKYVTFVYQIKKLYPELKKQKKSKRKKKIERLCSTTERKQTIQSKTSSFNNESKNVDDLV